MAVNLAPPDPLKLAPVQGVELGTAMAGVKHPGRRDLLVLRLAPESRVAGVFTQNRFCAAPVVLAKRHLAARQPRAFVVNTGNANAGTGEDGLRSALKVCGAVAAALGCAAEEVLPFSTGVIMEPLPADRIVAAVPAALADLRPGNWASAAQAIMTTDTVPKAASRTLRLGGAGASVTGIAKGAGMIRPDMATMLGFIACDAVLPGALLQRLLSEVVADTFNAITVDGDTSTNDSLMLVATGASGVSIGAADSSEYRALAGAVHAVALELAQAIVRDGEGATKFVTVRVEGGSSREECRKVAYAIAHSPLVKTAFFASDPNLGRILAAIGNAGVADLDARRVTLYLDDVLVARNGGRDPGYEEAQGVAVLKQAEFTVRAVLNRGEARATVWTSDLSFDYVRINAEYRT